MISSRAERCNTFLNTGLMRLRISTEIVSLLGHCMACGLTLALCMTFLVDFFHSLPRTGVCSVDMFEIYAL